MGAGPLGATAAGATAPPGHSGVQYAIFSKVYFVEMKYSMLYYWKIILNNDVYLLSLAN